MVLDADKVEPRPVSGDGDASSPVRRGGQRLHAHAELEIPAVVSHRLPPCLPPFLSAHRPASLPELLLRRLWFGGTFLVVLAALCLALQPERGREGRQDREGQEQEGVGERRGAL